MAASTMRALAVGADGVEVVERARPVPGASEVVVAVDACGICGSDVHLLAGAAGRVGQVIGHEFAGTVVSSGEDAGAWRAGERVAVNPLGSCGTCAPCGAGLPFRCEVVANIGVSAPGAFAEEVLVPARQLHRVPDGVPVEVGAHAEPLAVALAAIRLGSARPGADALVFGIGTIGLCVIAGLRALGAGRIVAVGRAPGRRRAASALGADIVLDARTTDLVSWARSERAAFESAYECSAAPGAMASIAACMDLGGTIVEVALPSAPEPLDLLTVVHQSLHITGACAFSDPDYARSLALLTDGRVDLEPLVSERVGLEQAPDAFRRLHDPGELVGIIVQPWR